MMIDYNITAKPWSASDPLPWWQWLKETPVMIVEENVLPQWGDAKQIYDAAVAMGATHVRYPAICWGMHYFSHSTGLEKYPALAPEQDPFGDVVKYLHDHDMKIMAYAHYGVVYRQVMEKHPDWIAKDVNGRLVDWENMNWRVCISNDEFVQAELTSIREMVEMYHPDSVYLDGPMWYVDVCYCENCQRKYKERWGEDMPIPLSWEDDSWLKYQRMREEIVYNVVMGVHEVTQKAGIPLQINTEMHRVSNHRHGITEMNVCSIEGANTTEVHRAYSRLWDIMCSAKIGESLKRVSMAYCPPGGFETLRSNNLLETLAVGWAYIMHGTTLMLESGTAYFYDTSGGEVMRQLTDIIRDHRDMLFRTQPVKELGLVASSSSFDLTNAGERYVQDPPKGNLAPPERHEYYCNGYTGAFEALSHGHRHFDCLTDAQLSYERIKDYKTLFLPVATRLDEFQTNSLKRYVEEGGTLILGPSTSLHNDNGTRRSSFALEDFMGVRFIRENDKSVIHYREYRESACVDDYAKIPEAYIRITCDLPGIPAGHLPILTSDAVVGAGNRVVDYNIVEPLEGTEVLAELYLPAGGAFGAPFEFPEGHPPAITRCRRGKGTVIYVACHPWYAYFKRGLPEQRNLIRAICDLACEKPYITCDAPAAVYLNCVEDANATYVHILNYCGNNFEKSVVIEEVVPIHDVTVKIRADKSFSDISLVFDDQTPEWELRDGYYHIKIKKLGLMQTIHLA